MPKPLLSVLLLSALAMQASAQRSDSLMARPVAHWGVEAAYGMMSYTESGVVSFHAVWTKGRHSIAFGPHLYHVDLFPVPDTWGRLGGALSYTFFPIGSHRMFSPFALYDLNYAFTSSRREVRVELEDGTRYGAVREVQNHALLHHFGIGVRANVHKRVFLSLAVAGGPGSTGDMVRIRSRHSQHADSHISEHPFSRFEPGLMVRFGLCFQMGMDDVRGRTGHTGAVWAD